MMQDLQLLDVMACNSANKQSFQNPTKGLFAQYSIDVKSTVTFLKCYWNFHIYGALGKKPCCRILKRSFISRITGHNVQMLQILAIFAS